MEVLVFDSRHKWPKSWERQFEKILLKHGWEKIPNWECLFVHREKGLFLFVYVDDIKLAGKKHNIDPVWEVPNKEVDLGEPTSFLDHVYLGCTQRQRYISKDVVDNYRTMFESRISAGATEKLPCSENLCISSWSYDVEGHAKKCVERYCELANKTTRQLYKVSTPCSHQNFPLLARLYQCVFCTGLLFFWSSGRSRNFGLSGSEYEHCVYPNPHFSQTLKRIHEKNLRVSLCFQELCHPQDSL